jgi:hypothetical protein
MRVKSQALIYSRRTIVVSAGMLAGMVSIGHHPVLALPPAAVPSLTSTIPQGLPAQQAAFLVGKSFDIADKNLAAIRVVVKTAAPLLARMPATSATRADREHLTTRWMHLAFSSYEPRADRLAALGSFFDSAVTADPEWARAQALALPDAAGRTGAFLHLSQALEPTSWTKAEAAARDGQRAAEQEKDPLLHARALVFVAFRLTTLGAAGQEEAIAHAHSAVMALSSSAERDNLLAELVGVDAKIDLAGARKMADGIGDATLKNLALARVNVSEISQTTLTKSSADRLTALATAAAPYDSRVLPLLLQLPPSTDVLKAVAAALPPIYPAARPAIGPDQLERIWDFAKSAPQSAYRDQLQSRVARLMVLNDLWRGRDWGKQLSWKGGRIQVGAFLKQVLEARRSQLQVGPLQDVAQRNVNRAYAELVDYERYFAATRPGVLQQGMKRRGLAGAQKATKQDDGQHQPRIWPARSK